MQTTAAVSPRLRLLDIDQLVEATGLPRSTIYAEMKRGRFPKPIKKIGRRVRWREITVIKHLEDRDRKAGNIV